MARGPSELTVATLGWALRDADTIARYRSHLRSVPGSSCVWWCGAVSAGRGHGRFWLARAGGRDIGIIAHRFAFGLAYGVDVLLATRVLAHACDNTLCQRLGTQHVRASSAGRNRREWAARRLVAAGPLADRRGPWGRARALRDALRSGGPDLFAAAEADGHPQGMQMPLWHT